MSAKVPTDDEPMLNNTELNAFRKILERKPELLNQFLDAMEPIVLESALMKQRKIISNRLLK